MKKITKKDIEEFVQQARKVYYDFYNRDKMITEHHEIYKAVNMLLYIERLWHYLTNELDCWYKGDNIICEAISKTILYCDTDVVDQLSFIEDLEKIALDSYEKNKCAKAK